MKRLLLITALGFLLFGCGKKSSITSNEKLISRSIIKESWESSKIKISFSKSKIPKNIERDNAHIYIAWKSDQGWIRMGNTDLDLNENIATAKIIHPGEYAVISRKKSYGIFPIGKNAPANQNPLILIHGSLSSSITWSTLLNLLEKDKRINRPVWIFEYPQNKPMSYASKLLDREITKLKKEFGDFRLDVITHGIGGLVVTEYVGKETYSGNIDRFLAIVPPFIGSNLVDDEPLEKLLVQGKKQTISDEDINKFCILHDVLGKNRESLSPQSEYLDDIFKRYHESLFSRDSRKAIFDEAIIGIKPWVILKNTDPHLYEIRERFGDGIIDSRLTSYTTAPYGRLSPLTMEPYDYDHFNILSQEDICIKLLDFLVLPMLYYSHTAENPTNEDLYKEAISNINLHKWRNSSTDILEDYNRNMLATCDSNAILFTNGDNDTFYAWNLQNIEGFRQDVRVVNLSLLNTHWYIKLLRDHEPKVPVDLTDAEIDALSPVRWKTTLMHITIPENIRKIEIERRRVVMNSVDEQQVERKLSFTVAPTYPENNPQIKPYILRIQDIMVLQILVHNQWKKPVYFSTTVSRNNMIGLYSHLRMDGLAYRITPYPVENEIDPEKLRNNLTEKFTYRNLDNPDYYIEKRVINTLQNYRSAFIQLIHYYLSQERKEDACEILDFMSVKIPPEIIPYSHDRIALAVRDLYEMVEQYDKAEDQMNYIDPEIELDQVERAMLYSNYAMMKKDFEKAEQILMEYFDDYSFNMEVLDQLLRLWNRQKKFDMAVDILNNMKSGEQWNAGLESRLQLFQNLTAEN